MLTLTENASTVIKSITDSDEAADANGLRISPIEDRDDFEIRLASATEPGDQVVEEHGATVYLEEKAAQMLDDKVLDAQVDQEGGAQFSLGVQDEQGEQEGTSTDTA
ncbi:MAG: Fe-S cluster assembly protein HesB [Nocardioidaceae bacterium]